MTGFYGETSGFIGYILGCYGNTSGFIGYMTGFFGNTSGFIGYILGCYGNMPGFYGYICGLYDNTTGFNGSMPCLLWQHIVSMGTYLVAMVTYLVSRQQKRCQRGQSGQFWVVWCRLHMKHREIITIITIPGSVLPVYCFVYHFITRNIHLTWVNM